jgi:hypothetical protein
MSASRRVVLPELLDGMDPDDPLARQSRRDLQRIHVVMGTLATLRRALARLRLSPRPRRILELGAGDGTLLLRVARKLAAEWPDVELTLLDRLDLVGSETREAYRGLGWHVSVVTTDVLAWARARCLQRYDLCMTTLFLHHFADTVVVSPDSALTFTSWRLSASSDENTFSRSEPGFSSCSQVTK